MEMFKYILIAVAVVVGLILLYVYVKHLFEDGYGKTEIYLHLFHDVPLRFLSRNRESEYSYSGSPYNKRKPEHEKVDPDSYPSAYCWNCDPEVVALMNAAPVDLEHDNQLLKAGGWKCACGKVNAAYVSSCSCGRNRNEERDPEPAPVWDGGSEDDEIQRASAIREYKSLMDDGILTQEEFEAKKKQLLGI